MGSHRIATLLYCCYYQDTAHMKKDTDLDPLRGRADFQKLLAELEAKFPPPRAK